MMIHTDFAWLRSNQEAPMGQVFLLLHNYSLYIEVSDYICMPGVCFPPRFVG